MDIIQEVNNCEKNTNTYIGLCRKKITCMIHIAVIVILICLLIYTIVDKIHNDVFNKIIIQLLEMYINANDTIN